MDWYIPITIIPGIAMIILSTSNIMLDLNREISELYAHPRDHTDVIKAKLNQLRLLSISIVFQYLGVLLFLLSGLYVSVFKSTRIAENLLIIGVVFIVVSIIMLLVYSIKAVKIRQMH